MNWNGYMGIDEGRYMYTCVVCENGSLSGGQVVGQLSHSCMRAILAYYTRVCSPVRLLALSLQEG